MVAGRKAERIPPPSEARQTRAAMASKSGGMSEAPPSRPTVVASVQVPDRLQVYGAGPRPAERPLRTPRIYRICTFTKGSTAARGTRAGQ